MTSEMPIDACTFHDLQATVGADFVGELVDTYCEETPGLLLALQEALDRTDADAFRRIAHSIKSSSASLGALNLAALARELEELGRAQRLDETASRLEPLRQAYRMAEQALRGLQHAT